MGSADLPDMLTEIYRTTIVTKKRWYLNLIFIILQGYTVGYVTVHNVFNYRFFRKNDLSLHRFVSIATTFIS